MGRKISNEEWKIRARSVHKDKYDYSDTIYTNSRTKVSILCNIHGVFTQSPSMHTNGRGCPKCGIASRTIYNWEDFPNLVKELNMDTNLSVGTSKLLSWKCSICEHEWDAPGNARVGGTGCPACANRVVHSDGRNSMANTHPLLAIELCSNEHGKATELIAGTTKKLPWKCSICEHQWKAPGYSRVNGTGCPACTNKSIHSDGRNSMANTDPELARELGKNEYGTANTLVAGTNKKLPWKCSECKHEWLAAGCDRLAGKGCPYCASLVVHSDGRNSMYKTNYDIAVELLPNEYGTAHTLLSTTSFRLPWQCKFCNNKWIASGDNRTRRNSGCPECAKIQSSERQRSCEVSESIYSTHPLLAKELMPNEYGTAKNLRAGSNCILPWRCSTCSHTWETSAAARKDGGGCGVCAGRFVHEDGRNSMLATHPELASELLPNRYGTSEQLIAGTGKILPWRCNICSYEWETSGDSRVRGSGCEPCSKIRSSERQLFCEIEESMSVTHPQIAKELMKNDIGNSENLRMGTNKLLPWQCSTCGWVWKTTGNSRKSGKGCRKCAKYGFDLSSKAHYYVFVIRNQSGDLLYYKGGISKNHQRRIKEISRSLPDHMNIQYLEHITFESGVEAESLERLLLEVESIRAPPRDFDGGCELFLLNPLEWAALNGTLDMF